MHDYPPPPDPATAVPGAPPDALEDHVGDEYVGDELVRGDLVVVTTWDTAAQVDVVRHGLVVDVVDEGVRVAWLDDVSHPIPLDPGVDARVDAPRVARLGG